LGISENLSNIRRSRTVSSFGASPIVREKCLPTGGKPGNSPEDRQFQSALEMSGAGNNGPVRDLPRLTDAERKCPARLGALQGSSAQVQFSREVLYSRTVTGEQLLQNALCLFAKKSCARVVQSTPPQAAARPSPANQGCKLQTEDPYLTC
jgi:hypothetical protein